MPQHSSQPSGGSGSARRPPIDSLAAVSVGHYYRYTAAVEALTPRQQELVKEYGATLDGFLTDLAKSATVQA